jgi:hypothetical protein
MLEKSLKKDNSESMISAESINSAAGHRWFLQNPQAARWFGQFILPGASLGHGGIISDSDIAL